MKQAYTSPLLIAYCDKIFGAATTKKHIDGMRVVCVDALSEELPALGQRLGRNRHLEIVDVHHQEELQGSVPIARSPVADTDETDTHDVLLAKPLQVSPRIRMPIRSKEQGTDR